MSRKDLLWIAQNARLRLTATPLLYHCEPIWSWKSDAHPDFAIWGIFQGSGEISINDSAHLASPGLCFLFKPQDRIEAKQDPTDPLSLFATRFEILDTDDELLSPQFLDLPSSPIKTAHPEALQALSNLAFAWSAESDVEKQLQDHAMRMLLLLIADASGGEFDGRAVKAFNAMNSDLGRKWTVQQLASLVGLGESHFSRIFSRLYGEAPIHFLIGRRMQEAQKRLIETSLSVPEIAHQLGYENEAFFVQLFRKRIGKDPEEVRRSTAL